MHSGFCLLQLSEIYVTAGSSLESFVCGSRAKARKLPKKKTEAQKCVSYLAWADSKPALALASLHWLSWSPAPRLLILIRRVGGVHT